MNKWNEFKDWLTHCHDRYMERADGADAYNIFTECYTRASVLNGVRAELEHRGLWDAPVWTSAWPTEEGMYWFYGTTGQMRNEVPELEVVKIVKVGDQFWGNMSGDLLSAHRTVGVWQRMVVPDLPDQEHGA